MKCSLLYFRFKVAFTLKAHFIKGDFRVGLWNRPLPIDCDFMDQIVIISMINKVQLSIIILNTYLEKA
jgi:hypothetical protein